jgi:hypothetical protein
MMDSSDDVKNEAVPVSGPLVRAALPGDPFPWAPEVPPGTGPEDSTTPQGSTPTPADSGDPASFDLGGGD